MEPALKEIKINFPCSQGRHFKNNLGKVLGRIYPSYVGPILAIVSYLLIKTW